MEPKVLMKKKKGKAVRKDSFMNAKILECKKKMSIKLKLIVRTKKIRIKSKNIQKENVIWYLPFFFFVVRFQASFHTLWPLYTF